MHINLFIAFGLRTILVMLVEILRSNSSLFDMNVLYMNQTSDSTGTTKSLDIANVKSNQTYDDENLENMVSIKLNTFSSKKKFIYLLLIFSKIHLPCRFIISIFRYSGSVYHVSIFSEAIYLMLLLKFPYYSEKKGSKFCILTSWGSFYILIFMF